MTLKCTLALMVFFICLNINLSAQLAEVDAAVTKGRHLKGQNGIEGNIGFTKLGKFFNVGYSRNFSNKLYGKIQAGIEGGKYRKNLYSFSSYLADIGIYYAPVNIKDKLFLGINTGLSFNADNIKGEALKENNFTNYGFFVGSEAEYFLSNKVVLLASFKQKFLLQKEYGTFVYFAGVGLKYVL